MLGEENLSLMVCDYLSLDNCLSKFRRIIMFSFYRARQYKMCLSSWTFEPEEFVCLDCFT